MIIIQFPEPDFKIGRKMSNPIFLIISVKMAVASGMKNGYGKNFINYLLESETTPKPLLP